MSVAPNSRASSWRLGLRLQRDDAVGAETLRGEHAAEADSAVADDRDGVAGVDPRADGRVVAGGEDVGERQQRREHRRPSARPGHRHERAVGERHADCLALAAVAVLRGRSRRSGRRW